MMDRAPFFVAPISNTTVLAHNQLGYPILPDGVPGLELG